MKLYILFGQRKEAYTGQFGIEALHCASEYDMDENPAYLDDKKQELLLSKDFKALEIVTLTVPEAEIEAILQPKHQTITAKVVKE